MYRGKNNKMGYAKPAVHDRIDQAWACCFKHSRAAYGDPHIALAKVRLVKAEVIEVMLYGCAIWKIVSGKSRTLRDLHRDFLGRCINKHTSSCRAAHPHMVSRTARFPKIWLRVCRGYRDERILLHPGHVVRMHDGCPTTSSCVE